MTTPARCWPATPTTNWNGGGGGPTADGNPAAAGGNRPPAPSPPEVVDWGRSGPNEMITLNALRALQAAGALTPPRTPT